MIFWMTHQKTQKAHAFESLTQTQSLCHRINYTGHVWLERKPDALLCMLCRSRARKRGVHVWLKIR